MEIIRKEAKVALYLDTRRPKEDGVYPVKLRVYHGKAKLFDTGVSLSERDFERAYLTQRPRAEYQQLRITLSSIEAKANEAIKGLKKFSFEKFEKQLFTAKSGKSGDIDHLNPD
jgi:hypothetical protein